MVSHSLRFCLSLLFFFSSGRRSRPLAPFLSNERITRRQFSTKNSLSLEDGMVQSGSMTYTFWTHVPRHGRVRTWEEVSDELCHGLMGCCVFFSPFCSTSPSKSRYDANGAAGKAVSVWRKWNVGQVFSGLADFGSRENGLVGCQY